MEKSEKDYSNNFSFLFGAYCVGVVFLHSSWAGGFDIYSFGIDSTTLKQGLSLLYMTIVPSFFILWGYLSCKYFSNETPPGPFFKSKFFQFYPLYLLSFVVNIIVRFGYVFALAKWKIVLAVLGVYYEPGLWGGGHIFLVVAAVIFTITFFKKLGWKVELVYYFCIVCLVVAKLLPHDESAICYVKYFGYYAAFFLGVVLKKLSFFENEFEKSFLKRSFISLIFAVGSVTPILNFFKINFLEINYSPNSPEQLCFCVVIIYLSNLLLNNIPYLTSSWFSEIVNKIGNNAYGHFLLQSHVIRLTLFLNVYFSINAVVVQVFIISCTSCIVVYLLLPLYRWSLESHVVHPLQRKFGKC